MEKELQITLDFVEGRISIGEFQKFYRMSEKLQEMAKNHTAGFGKNYANLYEFCKNINFKNPLFSDAVATFFGIMLRYNGIKCKPTLKYMELAEKYSKVIPDWLSDDAYEYLHDNVIEKLDPNMPWTEQKKLIKQQVKLLFKYKKYPPEFAQEGHWPFDEKENKFYIFDSQTQDGDKVTYKFVNQTTGEEEEYSEFY